MQLANPDVDRNNAPRSTRQQDFGEAACRGAKVQAVPACGIDPERTEGMIKLQPAARDPGMGHFGLDPVRVGT